MVAVKDAAVRLSHVLSRPLVARNGEVVGRLADVIVRLRSGESPIVIGLVAQLGGRRVFLPIERVSAFDGEQVQLTSEVVDLRGFERRDGEVLLRADVLGHRLVDVANAELVRASDVELRRVDGDWVPATLDVRAPSRWFGWLGRRGAPAWRDWTAFAALIGHLPSVRQRGPLGWLSRLKPAQIADLLEEARRTESAEILDAVHTDPELEADVFEELEPDSQARLLADKSDAEIAAVLARMRADDAADTIDELPQGRREAVLDLLPAGQRTKVLTLLGFNPTSAGGLMGLDYLSFAGDQTVADALEAVRVARLLQAEALTSAYVVDSDGRLCAVASLIRLLQSEPRAPLSEVADRDPARVSAEADLVDVAVMMADYNLITVPVVDGQDRILGLITVDDVLEAVLPEDWRRREPPRHPEQGPDVATAESSPGRPTRTGDQAT